MQLPDEGELVYSPYTPQVLAMVEMVEPYNEQDAMLHVRWMNGKKEGEAEVVDSLYVNRVDELIEDHRRKLRNHVERRDTLLAKYEEWRAGANKNREA